MASKLDYGAFAIRLDGTHERWSSVYIEHSGAIIAEMRSATRFLDESYAARIVACVNALAGMNPEALAELVAAAEAVLSELDGLDKPWNQAAHKEWEPEREALRAALAKLRGEA